MLILTTTTDTLETLLGAVPVSGLPCFVAYRDVNTTDYTPGRQTTSLTTNTVTGVLNSPAVNTQRVVDFVNIFNPNAAAISVSVRIKIGGVPFNLTTVVLATGERLEYQDGSGWSVYTVSGAIKQSLNQGVNSPFTGNTRVVLGADVVNNNAVANSIADVTGLSFPVTNGLRYFFKFVIRYNAAATTTGSRWAINGPSQNELAYVSRYGLTATTETLNYASAYDIPAASNASSVFANAANVSIIQGVIRPTADGTVIARFASEIASSAITAMAGSFVDYGTI